LKCISKEDRVLLYCSGSELKEEVISEVRDILYENPDWDYVENTAMKHGLSQLLYLSLKEIDSENLVPPQIMLKFKNAYYGNVSRNTLYYKELNRIVSCLKSSGVKIIVLKGAFLAEVVYGNIGLRPLLDIDLLVKKEDFGKVNETLVARSYIETPNLTELHRQIDVANGHEIGYQNSDKEIFIEIHTEIQLNDNPFQIDINRFWERAREINISGIEVLTFAPEDLLQHLCLHLNRHSQPGAPPVSLKWYCDIAEVIRYYENEINWDFLVESSKKYGIEEPIFQNLDIAKEYFGADVPDQVLEILGSSCKKLDLESIINKPVESKFSEEKSQFMKLRAFEYINEQVNEVEGISNKARYLLGTVFPSKKYMIWRHGLKNERYIYFYYFSRIFTSINWTVRGLWEMCRSSSGSKLKKL